MRGYERGHLPPETQDSSYHQLQQHCGAGVFTAFGPPFILSLWPWGGAKGDTGAGGLGEGHLVDAGPSWASLGACCLIPGPLACCPVPQAHCIQSQTPHYLRDAAKLEAVQRRAGRAVWGVEGLALVLAAGEGRRVPSEVRAFGSAGPSRKPEKL